MQRMKLPWQGLAVCAVWACGLSLLQGAATSPASQATQDETAAKPKKHNKKSADATASQTTLPGEAGEKTSKAKKVKGSAQDATSSSQAVPAEAGEKTPKTKRAKVSPTEATPSNSANRAMASESKTVAPSKNASGAEIQAAKASGQVWVNTNSGIYHKSGRWFGATKEGKFMSEQDAIKAGYKEAKNEK